MEAPLSLDELESQLNSDMLWLGAKTAEESVDGRLTHTLFSNQP